MPTAITLRLHVEAHAERDCTCLAMLAMCRGLLQAWSTLSGVPELEATLHFMPTRSRRNGVWSVTLAVPACRCKNDRMESQSGGRASACRAICSQRVRTAMGFAQSVSVLSRGSQRCRVVRKMCFTALPSGKVDQLSCVRISTSCRHSSARPCNLQQAAVPVHFASQVVRT